MLTLKLIIFVLVLFDVIVSGFVTGRMVAYGKAKKLDYICFGCVLIAAIILVSVVFICF